MKFIVALSFLVVLVSLFLAWKNAKQLQVHRKWTNFSFWATLGAVVLTELMVRLDGGADVRALFVIHLSFAVPYLLTLGTLRFWLTGLKNRPLHRVLGYATLLLFAGTFTTGMTLLAS